MTEHEQTGIPESDLEKIIEFIQFIYPNLTLGQLITLENYSDKSLLLENDNEREFALLLLSRGLLVFMEPTIDDCPKIPDFYVYNPKSPNFGKLVEITLLTRDGRTPKKKDQVDVLSMCNIPFVVLYREEQTRIKDRCWEDLF